MNILQHSHIVPKASQGAAFNPLNHSTFNHTCYIPLEDDDELVDQSIA